MRSFKLMRVVRRVSLLCLLGALAAACAYAPQDAVLTPNLTLGKIVSANNAPVSLEVVDERSGTVVGTRMTGGAIAGAEIKLAEITPLVQEQAKAALMKNEFAPLGANDAADRKLRVEVRAIEMETSRNFFGGKYHPIAAFKVTARNKAEVFEQFYRADASRFTGSPGMNTEGKNNRLLSDAVSKAMNEMLNDPALMGFLAR